MMWPGYPLTFYGIFLGHEHRTLIGERDVGGPQMRVVRQRMTENFDAVRTQHVEETLRVADAGDGVHGAAREFVSALGVPPIRLNAPFASSRMLRAPSRRARPPFTTMASAAAKRAGVSRKGPAGSSQPLPKRRSPSITTISQSRARA